MKPVRIAIVFLSILLLGGCSLSPGQHFSRASVERGELVGGGEVEYMSITPQLVSTPVVAEEMPAELTAYRLDGYRINPGDTLLITVWDHPEITTPAGSQQQALTNGRPVQSDGSLFFPYVGKIQAAGMTVTELRDTLQRRLGAYVVDPQVDVNVVGNGSRVSLFGAFTETEPQEIPVVGLTLSQAIGSAGIDVRNADMSGFVLTRDGTNHRLNLDTLYQNGKVAPDIFLKPGDRLFLPFNDRQEIYVLGEVLRPQSLPFKTTDLSLTQVLGRAGGLNPLTASGRAVYVIRGVDNLNNAPATVYHLDARSPVSFAIADRFMVRPGDVVWVGAAAVTRWNRFLTQLLPLTGIINSAANTQYNIERSSD